MVVGANRIGWEGLQRYSRGGEITGVEAEAIAYCVLSVCKRGFVSRVRNGRRSVFVYEQLDAACTQQRPLPLTMTLHCRFRVAVWVARQGGDGANFGMVSDWMWLSGFVGSNGLE